MNSLIEQRLSNTARQLLWVRTIRSSAVLLSVTTAALFLLGAMAKYGFVASSAAAWGWFAAILVISGLAWVIALTLSAVAQIAPEKLAHETERANPGLMDRLHTLVFLRPRRHVPQVESYAGRIEQQSAMVLFRAPSSVPWIDGDTLRWIAAWLVLLCLTILFYQWFRPFSELGISSSVVPPTKAAPSLELPPTPKPRDKTPEAEEEPWIEVRVSDPGDDLVATRFESVPLLVEAATSDALAELKLVATHNGARRRDVGLPTGPDPNFVRQEALFDLKLRGANDWDVLSYQATAASGTGMASESPIYFIDVRPTQEEIERLPGGAEGEAYRLLNDLTGMVGAQGDAVRAVHRHGGRTADDVDRQALAELAQAQRVMQRGVEYLQELLPEKTSLAATAEQLRRAGQSFEKSAELLEAGQTRAGELAAQQALGELAAARKRIHDAVRGDPSALPPPALDSDPLANLAEQLPQLAESQERLRTAAEEAARLAADERQVAAQVRPPDNNLHRQAAQRQQQLSEKFEQFQREHAQACEQASGACEKAGAAVGRFTAALEQLATQLSPSGHRDANAAGSASADALQQLASALEREAMRQQQAAARQLERALERQIQFLKEVEDRPDDFTQEQLEQAAQNMQTTTSALKQLAENRRTREQFSDKLREELNDENKSRLDQQCQGVCQNPGGGSGRSRAAAMARSGLRRVQSALRASPSGRAGRMPSENLLATDSSRALERARRQLASLLRGARGGQLDRASQQELLREALSNLRAGKAPAGRGAVSDDLLSALQEQAKNERLPIDLEALHRLLGQLDRVQMELVMEHETEARPAVTHLDPQNYPPGYRDWIQRYFRRLAEQK